MPDIEASFWIPYTDDGKPLPPLPHCLSYANNGTGAPLQRSCEQPSNVRSVYKCFCELSELVHQSLYVLHSPGRPLTSRDLLNIYTQYLNWYDKIPEVLRLGHNFTPAVLFAQYVPNTSCLHTSIYAVSITDQDRNSACTIILRYCYYSDLSSNCGSLDRAFHQGTSVHKPPMLFRDFSARTLSCIPCGEPHHSYPILS